MAQEGLKTAEQRGEGRNARFEAQPPEFVNEFSRERERHAGARRDAGVSARVVGGEAKRFVAFAELGAPKLVRGGEHITPQTMPLPGRKIRITDGQARQLRFAAF